MPLSEFLRRAREKLGSDKPKTCPTDISSRVEDDLVELVWDNGQVVMHGQSSRDPKTPTVHSLQSSATRVRESGVGKSSVARIGKFGGGETILNEVSPVVSSGELDLLSHNDEMVPWLNFPFDEDLPQDYCSELLPEISGVTADGMSVQHSLVSSDKRSSDHIVSNFHNDGNGSKGSSSKTHVLCSLPHQQGQTSDPSRGSEFSNVISTNNINHMNAVFGSPAHGRNIVNASTVMTGLPNNDSSWLNFSHFSRPTTLVKANLPNCCGIPVEASLDVEMMEGKEKIAASSGANPIKSSLNVGLKNTQKDIGEPANCALVNSRQQVASAPKEPLPAENTAKIDRVSSFKNDKPLVQTDVSNLTEGVKGRERNVEPVVASSSVGSANCADKVSCEKAHSSKRKIHEIEESEYHSDDTERESAGAKKATPSGGIGSKRSRAAEVHNLSERRRRDRINEKMRALQELIPNCNKADKASMLDEAIEYLKTLQLQVQIMSMGAGLCMPPPMMFSPGIKHIHPAHVPHLPPMGMGMAMGFGAGMLDLNVGGTMGCPIFPMPPMQGTHFPPPISGHANFPTIAGSNFPVFGHPNQGLNSITRAPLIPLMRPPTNSATYLSSSRMSHNEGPTTSTLNTKDPLANSNSLPMHNDEASSSRDLRSNQLEATEKVLDQSTAVHENEQTRDIGVMTARTSATATNLTGCD